MCLDFMPGYWRKSDSSGSDVRLPVYTGTYDVECWLESTTGWKEVLRAPAAHGVSSRQSLNSESILANASGAIQQHSQLLDILYQCLFLFYVDTNASSIAGNVTFAILCKAT